MTLNGKTILITGGRGGLGRGMAECLSADGAMVVTADVPGTSHTSPAENDRVIHLDLDVRARGAKLDEFVALVHKRVGPIHVLVNNAAIYPPGPWFGISDGEWDSVFDTNVSAMMRLVQAFRADLEAAGSDGRVINISSITFYTGAAGIAHYVSSKGAVIGLTRALARELGASGVTVNAIAPGAFPTAAEAIHDDLPAYERFVLDSQSLKRRGTPEDIGHVVGFFASEASSFVTGQTLLVDGGWAQA